MRNSATLQQSDTVVALSWAELGRQVRRRTFEAVTLHFALTALEETDDVSSRCGQFDAAGAEDRR